MLAASQHALAQKQGGIMRTYIWDNPPSGSIHEEATISTVWPFMSVFNNLVMYDPTKPTNTIDGIVPELAKSWSWDAGKTKLTMKLEEGVKWHDGKPFTAKDVQCTWHMLTGKLNAEDFRKNPRKVWYHNLEEVTVNGDHEVTFNLKAPQPSFLALLASGYSPVYSVPCAAARHAHQADRHRPVQVRRVSSATRSCAWCAIPTTGRRASPISTASTSRSSTTARRGCWPSSPASST